MICDRKIVAFCTARIHDTLNYDLLTTLNRQLSGCGVSVFVYNICSDNYWEEDNLAAENKIFGLVDFDVIDALIVMDEQIKSRTITDGLVKKANEHGKPVLIVNGTRDGTSSISFDYKKGFELVVRHVIEGHGIRDVMFMGGVPGNPFSDERERVFKKVLRENNIPFKKSMVSYGYFFAEATHDAVEKIICSGKIPKAIVCANDIMAISTVQMLQRFDMDLAESVIVTGFDGIDEIYFSSPQITSVKCNYIKLAKDMAELVRKMVSGKRIPKKSLVMPELVLAGSCGCAKTNVSPPDYFTKLGHRFFNFPEDAKSVFRVIDRMHLSDNIVDAANSLDRNSIYALSVVINPAYVETLEPMVPSYDGMLLFYDSDSPKPFRPRVFSKKDFEMFIKDFLDTGYPLIFNMLDYTGTPFGYVCFHFGNYNILNYARIPIVVTALRASIGGFASLQFQKHITERLDEAYKIDPLTGLYNRLGFSRVYKPLQEKLEATGGKLTVLLSDLDRLKSINDLYGHSAGDNAIQQVAISLKKSCPPSALCVRFGGDEMMAVIEGDVDAEKIREKIEKYLDDYNAASNLPYKVRSSVGIYRTDGNGSLDFESLVKGADKKLYIEKKMHHEKHKFSGLQHEDHR